MKKPISFSQKIRRRNQLLWGLFALMLVYMVVVGELGGGDSRMMSRLSEAASRIIFFGGMVWVLRKIYKNKKLLQNKELLAEKRLNEQDERNRYLYDKSGGIVWDALFFCLLFVTLTASLFDMAAFYTAFSLLTAAVLAKAAAWFYFSGE